MEEPPRERVPPPRERTAMHKWLTPRGAELYRGREEDGFEMYLSKVAEQKIRNHALAHAEERREVMGFLLGTVHLHRGREYTLVRDVATTDLDATAVSVRFDRAAFDKLFEELDGCDFRYVIVGWYHSHPSYTCFMSATDIQTQRSMFDRRFHTAIVIDPLNREIDAFYLENDRVESRPFAVYWDRYQNPYYGRTVRMRRLKEEKPAPPG
jgi:proteasome lid subunit RPN8/RPN11